MDYCYRCLSAPRRPRTVGPSGRRPKTLPPALALAALGLAAPLVFSGCQYECTGQDVMTVDTLDIRADIGCPSVHDAQDKFSEFGRTEVSLAGSKTSHPARKICWYRVTAPVVDTPCVDHGWTYHEPFERYFDLRSRVYYRAQALDPSGLVEYLFSSEGVISCDAGGRLFGVIQVLSDRATCPADPPAQNHYDFTLSDFMGEDLLPERLTCSYNATFRYMCGGLFQGSHVFGL